MAPTRIVTHADLLAIKARVQKEVSELDAAYLACASKLDASTKDSWATQKRVVQAWLDADSWVSQYTPFGPGAAQLWDEGTGLDNVLRSNWYPRFQAAGCQNVPTPPSGSTEPALSTANAESPLAWVAELPPMVMVLGLVLLAHELK